MHPPAVYEPFRKLKNTADGLVLYPSSSDMIQGQGFTIHTATGQAICKSPLEISTADTQVSMVWTRLLQSPRSVS